MAALTTPVIGASAEAVSAPCFALSLDLWSFLLRAYPIFARQGLKADLKRIQFVPLGQDLGAYYTGGTWTMRVTVPGRLVRADFPDRSFALDETHITTMTAALKGHKRGKYGLAALKEGEFLTPWTSASLAPPHGIDGYPKKIDQALAAKPGEKQEPAFYVDFRRLGDIAAVLALALEKKYVHQARVRFDEHNPMLIKPSLWLDSLGEIGIILMPMI